MSKDLSMYRYFKGEAENPYDNEKDNSSHNFWGYEQLFESKYNEGDFSASKWIPANTADINEWIYVLSLVPVNKEELFKLWIFNLLMVRLPEKYQSDSESFLSLYWETKV